MKTSDKTPVVTIALLGLLLVATGACNRPRLYLYSPKDRKHVEHLGSIINDSQLNDRVVIRARGREAEFMWMGRYLYPVCPEDPLELAAGDDRIVRGIIRLASASSEVFPDVTWAEFYEFYVLSQPSATPVIVDSGIIFVTHSNTIPPAWQSARSLPAEALAGTLPVIPVNVDEIGLVQTNISNSEVQ